VPLWHKLIDDSLNQEKLRQSWEVLRPALHQVCHACDPFLGKMERALCVWLAGKLQKWLSVSGTVAREKAITPDSGFKNLLEL